MLERAPEHLARDLADRRRLGELQPALHRGARRGASVQLSEAHLEIRTQAKRFADEVIRLLAATLAVGAQLETVDGEPGRSAAGSRVDVQDCLTTSQLDHENSPDPPRRRDPVRP